MLGFEGISLSIELCIASWIETIKNAITLYWVTLATSMLGDFGNIHVQRICFIFLEQFNLTIVHRVSIV